jgi:hypothetical protein
LIQNVDKLVQTGSDLLGANQYSAPMKAIVALLLASIARPMFGSTETVLVPHIELGTREVAGGYWAVSDADRKDRLLRVQQPSLPPARDPEVAVREEYELAQGNAAALELFMARHADHPLASAARRELEGLRRQGLR